MSLILKKGFHREGRAQNFIIKYFCAETQKMFVQKQSI